MGAFESTALSGTSNEATAHPMSRQLWGIEWRHHLPFESSGFRVCSSTYDRAKGFVAAHYATVFEEHDNPSPFATELTPARTRYYQLFGDFFEVSCCDEMVGFLICTPTDWSSYYIRSAAMVPKYQGRRIIQTFYTNVLFPVLKAAGVERVEFDTSPANMAMMHIATRLRFNNTGTILSERWGAMIHFTKFLSPNKEDVFLQQFCAGVKYQLRERATS